MRTVANHELLPKGLELESLSIETPPGSTIATGAPFRTSPGTESP